MRKRRLLRGTRRDVVGTDPEELDYSHLPKPVNEDV
jgi:5-methylcytosine-specific restriction endonuclease McrA